MEKKCSRKGVWKRKTSSVKYNHRDPLTTKSTEVLDTAVQLSFSKLTNTKVWVEYYIPIPHRQHDTPAQVSIPLPQNLLFSPSLFFESYCFLSVGICRIKIVSPIRKNRPKRIRHATRLTYPFFFWLSQRKLRNYSAILI